MFYKTRNNPKKSFKLLSCVIYTIIRNYVCIDYLACELKKMNFLMVLEEVLNTETKVMTKYWELELQIC